MKTTLNQIKSFEPDSELWKKLLRSLGKTKADDEPLSIIKVLESNGLDDAFWCLRAVTGHDREIRLYAVWCARQVQHLMTYPRSIAALDVAERFANGEATQKQLTEAATAAWDSAEYAATDSSDHAESDSVRNSACDAAWSSARAASGYSAGIAAQDAARSAARSAWYAALDAVETAARAVVGAAAVAAAGIAVGAAVGAVVGTAIGTAGWVAAGIAAWVVAGIAVGAAVGAVVGTAIGTAGWAAAGIAAWDAVRATARADAESKQANQLRKVCAEIEILETSAA